jgi:beta-lactam-binding protein with PASTA domain
VQIAAFAAVILVMIGIMTAGISLYRNMFVYTRMPDLTGVDAATAERMAATAGLSLRMDQAYSDVMEGYVCAQSPASGEKISRGETASVTISRGSDQVVVQRYIGMTQQAAIEALAAQGFIAGDVTAAPSEQLRGTVIAQTPEAGSSQKIGSRIDLTVSGGRVVVPELTGEREEEALALIKNLGLSCGMVTYENVMDARMDGVVLSQSLERFAEVLPGSVVEMSVGLYDKRKYTASVEVNIQVPKEGVLVRVTLVGPDGKESDMYAATHSQPGETKLDVLLRSEESGVMTWRLYLDGGFRSEATAVLQ